MCIAIVKPKGVKCPTKATLKRCFDANSDGAGLAIAREGETILYKGLMDFEEFWQAYREVVKKELAALLHFRIATHGARDATATHPFPLSPDEDKLKAKCFKSRLPVAIHNGVLSGYGSRLKTGLSDTQEFIKKRLASVRDVLSCEGVRELVKDATGSSKWGLLLPDGTTYTLGFFNSEEGVEYSNRDYVAKAVKVGGFTRNDTTSTGKLTDNMRILQGDIVEFKLAKEDRTKGRTTECGEIKGSHWDHEGSSLMYEVEDFGGNMWDVGRHSMTERWGHIDKSLVAIRERRRESEESEREGDGKCEHCGTKRLVSKLCVKFYCYACKGWTTIKGRDIRKRTGSHCGVCGTWNYDTRFTCQKCRACLDCLQQECVCGGDESLPLLLE